VQRVNEAHRDGNSNLPKGDVRKRRRGGIG
jgi:hypothetical protein